MSKRAKVTFRGRLWRGEGDLLPSSPAAAEAVENPPASAMALLSPEEISLELSETPLGPLKHRLPGEVAMETIDR